MTFVTKHGKIRCEIMPPSPNITKANPENRAATRQFVAREQAGKERPRCVVGALKRCSQHAHFAGFFGITKACSFVHRSEPLRTKISSSVFSAPKYLQASLVLSLSCFAEWVAETRFSAKTICTATVIQIPLESDAIIPSSSHLST